MDIEKFDIAFDMTPVPITGNLPRPYFIWLRGEKPVYFAYTSIYIAAYITLRGYAIHSPIPKFHTNMRIRNIAFRLGLGLLLIIYQCIVPDRALAAVQNAGDHRFLLFFSSNVLGELEPCG